MEQLPASDLAALCLSSVELIGEREPQSHTCSSLRASAFASLNLLHLAASLFDPAPCSITPSPDLSVSLRVASLAHLSIPSLDTFPY